MPVTIPVLLFMLATDGVLLVQVPLLMELLNVLVVPGQTTRFPPISPNEKATTLTGFAATAVPQPLITL